MRERTRPMALPFLLLKSDIVSIGSGNLGLQYIQDFHIISAIGRSFRKLRTVARSTQLCC